MKKALEKYKNNPDVAFIFIDTWERDDDREKKVTDFIAQNKYPFRVLYDKMKSKESDEFVVVQDYKVDGIPTKFVIDRNSNIRFKNVGWNGNADELVNELTVMIDLAKDGSGEPAKKAF
jgi:peroxiredoxin